GVRIERVERAGNGSVVDGFVGLYGVGEILFNGVVNLRELLQAEAYRIVGGRSLRTSYAQHHTGNCDESNRQRNVDKTTASRRWHPDVASPAAYSISRSKKGGKGGPASRASSSREAGQRLDRPYRPVEYTFIPFRETG